VKAGIQLSLLILMFGIGWVSRGLMGSTNVAVQEGIQQTQISNETVAASSAQSSGETYGEQTANTLTVPRISISSETKEIGHVLNENLLRQAEQLLFQNRITQFSKYVRQYSEQFSPRDVDALGALFATYVLQYGLDEYGSSFELMNIETRLSSLDPHAPSSQFFDVLEQTGIDPQSALATFDELSSYYQEQVSDSQLKQLEDWLIAHVENSLRAKQDWSGLEQWYQTLISRSGNPERLYRRLAALYFNTNRHVESLDSLDKLASYSNWNKQDEQLYQANTVAVASDSVEAIALQKIGEHFIVNVRINNRVEAPMLLDTGASISGLDRQFISSQGFNVSGRKIRLSTAGGRVDADLIRLDSVTFGDNQLVNLDVASIGLNVSGHSAYQGLLGMDILGRYKFYLDQRQAILYLRSNSNTDELPLEF